jgi:hypothetical protein
MDDERVYDFGPPQDSPDRAAWVKVNGPGPVRVSIFSAGECIERDPKRYSRALPAGVSVPSESK